MVLRWEKTLLSLHGPPLLMPSSSNSQLAPPKVRNTAPSRSDFPTGKSKEHAHGVSLQDWWSTGQKLTSFLEAAMSASAGASDWMSVLHQSLMIAQIQQEKT